MTLSRRRLIVRARDHADRAPAQRKLLVDWMLSSPTGAERIRVDVVAAAARAVAAALDEGRGRV